MKTMTCRQMGGPCDAEFHGNKADDVIKAQDAHLKEMVASGDETHRSALEAMQGPMEASHLGTWVVQSDEEGVRGSSRGLIVALSMSTAPREEPWRPRPARGFSLPMNGAAKARTNRS
jgi:hypothetical protein